MLAAVERLRTDLADLLRLIRSHPELLDLQTDGACSHGNGRKRGCRLCQRDYMRDYRERKRLGAIMGASNADAG